MALVVTECTVDSGEPRRLDQIVQSLTGRSRSEVRGLLDQDCVQLNGRICKKPGLIIDPGSVVTVKHDPNMRYREAPRERPPAGFRVLFEDEHLIVVDKAPGILTVQTDHGGKKTLVDAVTDYLRRRHRGAKAIPVHRLDRDTSGVLVLGKNARIAEELMEQFRIRKAEREYAAIVAGKVTREQGTFRTYMATSKRLQRYSVGPGEQGELAITHYRVVQHLKGATYVRATLETGRRNQIRVHFSEVGHPVLGDDRYRSDLSHHPAWKGKGLALHAALLGFDHPVTGAAVRYEAPLPKEFERFLRGGS
ncbi:RluA family pseudouridine synthase [Planctomicrobium piriforme]|uniref:Pseudouridine synthase n=1 Tax=Planctomicrobium piriforme TaxID=1576369 RepID=A0A1I3AWW9_9PLAN|nr:RluA family pseudouridine synthase [Planctomicrobium piriforme]SFH54595.1 23S rRNA pseudouridine1911/1915/1917 synthase [Planctomicrobium piriforme]